MSGARSKRREVRPFIVRCRRPDGELYEVECGHWGYACAVMRALLLEGCDSVTVAFA